MHYPCQQLEPGGGELVAAPIQTRSSGWPIFSTAGWRFKKNGLVTFNDQQPAGDTWLENAGPV
ncbi:MAG TPA: hypothetical protein VMT46_17635 [Anaerolineaceae bacterium]|nr:hypothetical protein [Anaerolineaceae bacterium]